LVTRERDRVTDWLTALEERHLAVLTPSEVARALRALSSCYVERRAKLGQALDTAGKRAAFALFYAPLHFLTTREVVRALGKDADDTAENITRILDLGCGTGAAGAAWALDADRCTVNGVDRNRWAVTEANWTYRALELTGHAAHGDVEKSSIRGKSGHAVLAAYTVNELPDAARDALLPRLVDAHERGSRILIIEPIARRMAGWWDHWERAFKSAGGRADEWRFGTPLPARQRQLGRAAGLDPRELTARSLWL
jgi:hypothetical protein